MGRLIGKKPDPTAAIAKAAQRHLQPGERVLAGVYVQQPGTLSAQMSGGVDGAVTAAVGTAFSFEHERDPQHDTWLEQSATFDIDAQVAKRSPFVSLVLTDARLLLLRRSRLTRRTREVIAAWPLSEIDAIEVPRNSDLLRIRRAGAALTLELPHAHRFLPQVYRDLPKLLARAAAHREPAASA